MIEMTLKIQDVDYAAAVDVLIPVLLEKLSSFPGPIPLLLLGRTKGLPATAAKAALDVLPKGTKEELAAACLNHYSDEVVQAIESLAVQKGIRLNVESVEATVSSQAKASNQGRI